MTVPLTAPVPAIPAASPAFAPRLLFVVRGAEGYGTETKILGFFTALAARGMTVSLFALGDGGLAQAARAMPALRVHLDPAPPPRMAGGPGNLRAFAATQLASLATMRRLRALLARERFDAMVICEHGLVLQIGAVARLSGVPVFWIMANAVDPTYRFDINRRLYAAAFRHLAVIPVANSAYTRTTLGRGARYAEKIDLGIDPRRVVAATAATLPGLPPGAVRLLVMARLVPAKGQKILLAAMLSRPEFRHLHLILCGGPPGTPYERDLRELAAARGAADRLHVLGPVTDVAAYYALADVVVNARLDPEPFGLSVVEAMFAARPLLVHAAGGPAEIVVDGLTGWHVAAPEETAFADGLARMLADRPRWAEMGLAGRKRAEQRYTHEAMTDQFLRIAASRLRR